MPIAVDEYFNHMKKIVYGGIHPIEYKNKYKHKFGQQKRGKPKWYQCPKCQVWYDSAITGKETCPICER